MDKLAKKLRDDAAAIDARVSVELDDRIRASLEGISPDRERRPSEAPRRYPMWWASLTGLAVAASIIVIMNVNRPQPVAPPQVVDSPPEAMHSLTNVRLRVESADLTSPLQKELENLQSDIKKAEKAVRKDIELVL